MTKGQTEGGNFTRRNAILGMAASAAYSFCPSSGAAASDRSLHEVVAQRVRELAGGRQLKLRLLLPNGSGGNVNPIISVFQSMTGIEVLSFETPVDEINTELSLDALSNSKNYDVALPATFGVPDLVASGAIIPITEFAKRYEPQGFREDILFGVGDSFDNEIYGFQTDGDAYTMFYHKGMLENPDERARYEDAFGQVLSKPETWRELDQQMAFFNRPDEGQWGGLLFRTPSYLAWEWWVRFHAKGIWPFSFEMQPQIASDAGVEALEEMIRATDYLHPETSQLGLFGNWERYSRGDVFCNIGWGGSQKYLNGESSNMRGNMVFGPTPGGIVNEKLLITPYFNWGWNYVVSSNSDLPEIAYLFALFASTPQMSTLAVRQSDGFFDPFRPEHYEDEGIKSAYSPEFLTVQRASLESAIPDLYLENQGEYFRVLSEWLTRALAREVTPRTALERVAQRWQLITNGSGRPAQKTRWAQLRAKYPKQIRDELRDIM
ncbi:extracellular solute-binding protein [uncultured Thioclava sp.]|uniref:extracellular solute-binding protein n=1 Tax=uncultured Thioclava sp. TaxID=473858 RepID=UPI0025E9D0BD|nr:extracellular solute-binding protein [uncultured Thioclava sp.]